MSRPDSTPPAGKCLKIHNYAPDVARVMETVLLLKMKAEVSPPRQSKVKPQVSDKKYKSVIATQKLILQHLEFGPRCVYDMAKKLDLSVSHTRKRLAQLEGEGVIYVQRGSSHNSRNYFWLAQE